MARQARIKSKTGIYHIMLRGIDGRDILLDDEDSMKFIEKLLRAKQNAGFKLYGYCLMDNHVHLLIEEIEEIGTSIKRITVGYVQWHNNKYGRTGHLFQNRYQYISVYQGENSQIDSQLIKSYFQKKEDFEQFMNAEHNDECLEYKPSNKYTNAALKKIVHEEYNVGRFKEMLPEERNKLIKNIYQNRGEY